MLVFTIDQGGSKWQKTCKNKIMLKKLIQKKLSVDSGPG